MKSGTLTNLAATSLRDQAKAAIMAAIVAGELQADALYSVQFFIDRLGVSATPIREALLDLASEHIVEVVRNRGYRVPTLTDKQLDDLLEVRLMLEVPGTVAAVDHLTDADIRLCAETADRCAEHARTGNLVGFVELDRASPTSTCTRTPSAIPCSLSTCCDCGIARVSWHCWSSSATTGSASMPSNTRTFCPPSSVRIGIRCAA